MQVAPLYKLPKGKPVWLLISAKTDNDLNALRDEFAGKVRFIKLNPKSTDGQDAMSEFSINEAPASVLANSNGCIVEKIEGKTSAAAIRARLKTLVGK